jgi:hypothetical protein
MELAGLAAQRRLPELEQQLDEAVFDLYGLDDSERDLILDMCSLGLDLFYRHHESEAVLEVQMPADTSGTHADIADKTDGLANYIRILIEHWNSELKPSDELAWHIMKPPSGAPLLAVLLEPQACPDATKSSKPRENDSWQSVLQYLNANVTTPAGSQRVLVDTFFRTANENCIAIVKRNERRFWTASAAREDAEVTLLRGMISQEKASK